VVEPLRSRENSMRPTGWLEELVDKLLGTLKPATTPHASHVLEDIILTNCNSRAGTFLIKVRAFSCESNCAGAIVANEGEPMNRR